VRSQTPIPLPRVYNGIASHIRNAGTIKFVGMLASGAISAAQGVVAGRAAGVAASAGEWGPAVKNGAKFVIEVVKEFLVHNLYDGKRPEKEKEKAKTKN